MFPTQITLRNLRPSLELSTHVRDLCEKLSHLHSGILNCRVSIEQPFVRTRRRIVAPQPYIVDVQVRLAGLELLAEAQADPEVKIALRKAFTLVRRQLRELAEVEREARRRAAREYVLKF